MRHADEIGGKGAVLRVALILTAGGKRPDGRAMVVAIPVEDLGLAPAMTFMRDLAHHLERLLVRLGPGVAVIDTREAWHLVDQLFGKDRAGDRTCCTGEVIQLYQLVTDCVRDALAAIADVDRPHTARDAVQQFGALLVPDVDTLAFGYDPRLAGFKLFVLNEVVPNVGLVGLHDLGDVVVAEFAVHESLLSRGMSERVRPTSRLGNRACRDGVRAFHAPISGPFGPGRLQRRRVRLG